MLQVSYQKIRTFRQHRMKIIMKYVILSEWIFFNYYLGGIITTCLKLLSLKSTREGKRF